MLHILSRLVCEEVISRSLESLTCLLEQLTQSTANASGKTTKGVLQSSVQFQNGKTVFSPDHSKFLAVIQEDVFEGIASVLQQVTTDSFPCRQMVCRCPMCCLQEAFFDSSKINLLHSIRSTCSTHPNPSKNSRRLFSRRFQTTLVKQKCMPRSHKTICLFSKQRDSDAEF